MPDALLVDAAIRYDQENRGVSLNVNNLLDKRYVSGCQGALTCNYGEGRSALLKTHFTW